MKKGGSISVEEAAARLGMNPQMVRWRMRKGRLPIGICAMSKGRWRFIVFEKWLDRFLDGDPVVIPEGMSDKED